ncbi:helix-turn-helix domain-containing protein [Cesiribacter sp. SM1]|uniref:helix-turn-helix domain-containing protein n=1 Tax=Cesiribacter sp. SM1 TaxID=2861196 RepID=UPI001CD43F86|nr:helix-turn-helix domain-containing protein [Cesiribacter sp. SM1]
MQNATAADNMFLDQLTEVVEKHIADENFGVSELAIAVGMSRSNLLRKVKQSTNLSVSQFIRQVRLQKAMILLQQNSLNVSEVSYQVGFSSTSYFIKCFREHYGYSPGEVGKREVQAEGPEVQETMPLRREKSKLPLIFSLLLGLVLVAALFLYSKPESPKASLEKSIVVLPFKNSSSDSTNIYLINGLMESTLNNLQKIKDMRVLSRTSAEKYRNTTKSIPEMAEELNVSYFVEGSGQKVGDRILLNIQLIDASTDTQLWAKQYERQVSDIFELQQEIAKSIAEEIQAVFTPEEEKLIDKIPTNNLVAYDYYLKGLNYQNKGGADLIKAIPEYKKAIDQDPAFALAHANLAITYSSLDVYQDKKKYLSELNVHADKALLLDPKLAESLLAKALFYINNKEYAEAPAYLEKALEYNPNSAMVINMLSLFYSTIIPDTGKFIEYALRGVKLDIAANDSVITSYIYLNLSNALIQSGFVDEAIRYVDKSLEYNPANYYSNHLKAFILFAKNKDLDETRALLIRELKKDTTRLDIMQDLGKVCFYQKDYKAAYQYYNRFVSRREALQLDIYQQENLLIGTVMKKMGHHEKAARYIQEYKTLADNNESNYKPLLLAAYHMHMRDQHQALEQLELFSQEENIQYWVVLFIECDPLLEPLFATAAGKEAIAKVKTKFWKNHAEIKARLKKESLI